MTSAARVYQPTKIANHLKQMIMDGHLRPGDQLPPEHILVEQFDVSRSTLREGVQMLRSTGLLEVSPGRGSFVRKPNFETAVADIGFAAQFYQLDGTVMHKWHAQIWSEIGELLLKKHPQN